METGLAGKTAIVLAASSGFGKSTANYLAREGARVAICARDPRKLETAAREIEKDSGQSLYYEPVNVSEKESLTAFIAAVKNQFGKIEILVYNAGGPPARNFYETTDEDWNGAYHLNLMSAVWAFRAVIPEMKTNNWGRIVNITSLTVKQPSWQLVLSNTFRSGLVALAKTLAPDLARNNITINNIAPGFHQTPAIERIIDKEIARAGSTREEIISTWTKNIPVGRLGTSDELAQLAVFLCSDGAGFITGQTILNDGGQIRCL